MEANQKFFPVLNHEHRLTERFIGIANIDSRDVNQVRKGYERVIRPRFADAQFFYDEDLKQGLESMRQGLASVTYQQKLGSYADKSARARRSNASAATKTRASRSTSLTPASRACRPNCRASCRAFARKRSARRSAFPACSKKASSST